MSTKSTAPAEEYLMKRYQKWDHFKDDFDEESESITKAPTQFDVEGDEDIVIRDQILLNDKQIDQYRKLDKPHQEVWQIVVRKLRVWSASSEGAAEGDDAIPCRPYCILVNNLYPLGQVISKKIMDPPEQYPTASLILELTLQAMMDPPTSTPQHRPDKIVFPNKSFVGELRKSYAAIGIECTYLSESQGIDTYIQELSNHLVQKDLASIADVSERPGLVSGKGITSELLQTFYTVCATYARLEPWKSIAERQAIQIDAQLEVRVDKHHSVGRGTVFSSVIGTPTSQGLVQGMALFFTRTDLERRVLPTGEQLASMENPALRRCAYCDRKARVGSELKRCTRCKCTFYCNAECQKTHWPDHKVSCHAPVAVESREKTIQWGMKEMSVIYGAATSMTFDDLDTIDLYHLEIAKVDGEWMYPTAIVFMKGEPHVPTASDLLWLTRGLLCQIHLSERFPLFLERSMSHLLGINEEEEDNIPTIELKCQTLGIEDHMVVRNSSVLTMADVEKLRAYVAKQKVGSPRIEEGTEGEEDKEREEGGEDGKCMIM